MKFCVVFVRLAHREAGDKDEKLGWAKIGNRLELHAREFGLSPLGLHRKPSKVLSMEGA